MLFFTVFFAFVVIGFLIRFLCAALEGRDAKLPDWSDLQGLFQQGLAPVLITLAYAAPLVLIMIIEIQLVAFGFFAGVFLWPVELLALLFISMLLPLALIRCVIKVSLKSAFEFGKIFEFLRLNFKTYFTAWGVAVLASLAAYLVSFLVLVAIGGAASFLGFGGIVVGLIIVAAVFFIAQFIASLIGVHLFALAYRASTPFSDDSEGIIRASMAVPPPLRE